MKLFPYLWTERTLFRSVANGTYWIILLEFYLIFWNFNVLYNFFLLLFSFYYVKLKDDWRELIVSGVKEILLICLSLLKWRLFNGFNALNFYNDEISLSEKPLSIYNCFFQESNRNLLRIYLIIDNASF
jgi:hypothetical protein